MYDDNSGAQLAAKAIEGRSRIISLTSTTPESLLRSPIRRVVHELYGAAPPPEQD